MRWLPVYARLVGKSRLYRVEEQEEPGSAASSADRARGLDVVLCRPDPLRKLRPARELSTSPAIVVPQNLIRANS
jgi:hypothetical protein